MKSDTSSPPWKPMTSKGLPDDGVASAPSGVPLLLTRLGAARHAPLPAYAQEAVD